MIFELGERQFLLSDSVMEDKLSKEEIIQTISEPWDLLTFLIFPTFT